MSAFTRIENKIKKIKIVSFIHKKNNEFAQAFINIDLKKKQIKVILFEVQIKIALLLFF